MYDVADKLIRNTIFNHLFSFSHPICLYHLRSQFAVPAIGVWLCSPILSLIDTSAVGVLSGTVQQAALNPAVAVTDYAALLIVSSILDSLTFFTAILFRLLYFTVFLCRPFCTLAPLI